MSVKATPRDIPSAEVYVNVGSKMFFFVCSGLLIDEFTIQKHCESAIRLLLI